MFSVLAPVFLGAFLASPALGEWRTVFSCAGDGQTDKRVADEDWVELAKSSVGLRICTAGSSTDCVIATGSNSALNNLRVGNMNLQKGGQSKCDRNCIDQQWSGPDSLLKRLTWTCNPQFGNSFFHACGNHGGLHMWRSKSHCEWDWTESSSLVVQVDYIAPPPFEWKTIFNCDGDGKTDNRVTEPEWQSMARNANYLRVCTAGSDSECVTARPANVGLLNLRNGIPSLQLRSRSKCDRNCINQLWSGPDALLDRLTWTCTPQFGNAFYHACGNHEGLHMWRSKSHCEWDWTESSALVVQIDYNPVKVETEWKTIFECAGDGLTDDRFAEDQWQQLAQKASSVRICTAFNENECVVATGANSAIENLRRGDSSLQKAGRDKCDRNCIRNLWSGSEALLNRLTWNCKPTRDSMFFHACGNHGGLHISNGKNSKHCEWDWTESDPLVVQIEVPKPNYINICPRKYRTLSPKCKNLKCFDNVSVRFAEEKCQADDACDGFSFQVGKSHGRGCLKKNCKGSQGFLRGFESGLSYYECTHAIEAVHTVYDGMTKIAENVCIGTRGDRFGTFQIPYDIQADQVRIVHRSGHVQCRSNAIACNEGVFGTKGGENKSYFGCECNGNVNIQVTDSKNVRVVPGNGEVPIASTQWYKLPGFNSHSEELVFSGKKKFKAGESYRLWYGEDLVDHTLDDNHGSACYDIYANVELTCPPGSRQVGTLTSGNDIAGCGFGDCDSWYRFDKYDDVFQCAAACLPESGCKSFTYAPVNGEKHWMSHKVCTHYSGSTPNQSWGPKQIMCVLDQANNRRRLEDATNRRRLEDGPNSDGTRRGL